MAELYRPILTRKRHKVITPKPSGSIAHATAVLITLSNDVHTVTDISRLCGLGKSTVHRVLKLLERSQLVVQDVTNRRYYLGPLVTQLASNPLTTHEYLIMYAREDMNRLSYLSEETVALDIMIGVNMYSLHEVSSPHDLKVTREGNSFQSNFAGSSSKVLLSLLDNKMLKSALNRVTITPNTDRTVTEKDVLIEQIKDIREKGYAVTYGERIIGGMGISVPIKHYMLPVALSIVGPESRLGPKTEGLIESMLEASHRISENVARVMRLEGNQAANS